MKKLSACCLLVLALSPYTAPFRVIDSGNSDHLIPSVESLTALRDAHDPCSIMAARSSQHYDAAILPLLVTLSLAGCSFPTFVTRSTLPSDAHGDYLPSAAILRL